MLCGRPVTASLILLLVTHWVSHAHRADVCVWFITILVGTAAKGLGACQQLHMGLNTNDGFILQQPDSNSNHNHSIHMVVPPAAMSVVLLAA